MLSSGPAAKIDGKSAINCHPQLWAGLLFEPDDLLEIRCIPPKQIIVSQAPARFAWKQLCRQHTFNPWVRAGEVQQITSALKRFNHVDGVETSWVSRNGGQRIMTHLPGIQLNIYASANPRDRLGGKARDCVPAARSLFVDLESVSVDQAVTAIAAASLPDPTMVVNSGHGVHAYWRLTSPIVDLGLWSQYQKRLIAALTAVGNVQVDSKIHDPARVMRLPGFQNTNGTPSLCSIAQADPDRRYDISTFDTLPPLAARCQSKPKPNGKPVPSPDHIARPDLLARATAYQDQIPEAVPGERNSQLFRVETALVEKFDLGLDDLFAVGMTYNSRLDEPLDEGEVRQVAENALAHVHQKDQPRGTLLTEGTTIETRPEPGGPVVPLADWQDQMRAARIDSLNHPGTMFFDGSATGAGKSTADLAAMAATGRSITFLPTHEACRELADTLTKRGLKAAAYPRIDGQTCQRYGDDRNPGDALIAQKAGLDVGVAICPECPYYKKCIYQQQRDTASTADHSIATHARAAHSVFAPVKDNPVVFIHEDCLNLLRPVLRVSAKKTAPAPNQKHLEEVLAVAREAVDIAKTMGDEQKEAFAVQLCTATKQLLTELKSRDFLCDVEQATNGQIKTISRVKPLSLNQPRLVPDRTDYLLYRAMRNLGIHLNGDATRLCLAHACGDLERICVVIDDNFAKGGAKQYHKCLVGVRRIDPPSQAVVWLEDATGDYMLLQELLRRPVCDRTPVGRLEWQVPPVQYVLAKAADITKEASGNTVRGLVRGLLAERQQAHKVGIITHKSHLPALEQLEPYWRSRITRMDYFRSGNDRASNKWLPCDLLIILGTPRVPPAAVREGLIQISKTEEAGRDGGWTAKTWEGKATDGQALHVQRLGYSNPSWDHVHGLIVRNTLIQAIGRGRGVREGGVPVIVISNEPLSLPLISHEPPLIKDQVAKTFIAFQQLTVISPKSTILGKMTVSSSMIAEVTGYSVEETRRHFVHLNHLGLLQRKGERGGWMVNSNAEAKVASLDLKAETLLTGNAGEGQ